MAPGMASGGWGGQTLLVGARRDPADAKMHSTKDSGPWSISWDEWPVYQEGAGHCDGTAHSPEKGADASACRDTVRDRAQRGTGAGRV